MPKIETYSAQAPLVSVRASTSDFADTSGMESMAQSLEGAGDVILKIQKQRDTLDYTKRASDLQLQLMKDAEQINNNDVPEGKNISDLYDEMFKARVSQFKIPSSIKSEVELDIENMRKWFISNGIQEQARQAGIRARTDWEQSLINAENIVSMNPNMAAAMQSQLEKAASSLNLADAERDGLFVDAQMKIAGAQAGAVAKSSPGAFIAQAKAGKWNHVPNLDAYVGRAESEIKQAAAEAASDIEAETRNVINGFPSSPTIDAKIQKYANSGDAKISAAYKAYQTAVSDVASYKEMPPTEIAAHINKTLIPDAYKDGATDIERLRLDIAQKYLSMAAQQIGDDTISYAVKNGVLREGVLPLDISKPETFSSRLAAMKTAADKYGYSTFTTSMDRAQLGAQLQSMQPKEKVQFLSAIRENTGDYATKVISEIAKDSGLELEYVGGMVAADKSQEKTASIALSGMRIMELDKARRPEENAIAALEFGDDLKSLDPETQAAMRKTATAIYVGLGGDKSMEDESLKELAVKYTLGAIDGWDDTGKYEINGKETFLPVGVRGRTFQKFIDNLSAEDFATFKVNGFRDRFGPVSAFDVKQNMSLTMTGSTGDSFTYAILNDDEGVPYFDEFGKPAQITFTKQQMINVLNKKR